VDNFRRCIAYDPKDARAHYFLGMAYNRIDEVDKAIEAFEMVTRLMPDDCKAYYYLGIAYDKKGLPTKARDAYATADKLLK